MSKIITAVKQWFLDMKLSTKFIVLSLCMFLITVSLSCYFYFRVSSQKVIEKVSEISIQSLTTISDNINTEIKNAKNLSNIFLSSDIIQKALKTPSNQLSLSQITEVDSFIGRFRNSVPVVSSIYIYDNFGSRYYTDPFLEKILRIAPISKAPWYQDVLNENGGYILRLNADNAFISNTKSSFVSLIRSVNDLETMKPIGTLIINIQEKSFRDSFKNVIENSDFDIALVDKDSQFIVPFGDSYDIDLQDMKNRSSGQSGQFVKKYNKHNILISYVKMENTGWALWSIIPVDSLTGKVDNSLTGIIIIVIINSALLIIGLIFITQLATVPLGKLGKAMEKVKKREFKQVHLNVGKNEIGDLQECYNIMILEIEGLIEGIIREQNKKRKAALNLLQAQFKPHFLYNSIDLVRSMLLMDKKEEANRLLKDIGSYYRICLSKGKEVITIEDEINMVKSYLLIQDIYHQDLITTKFDIDVNASSCMILKFVLQPLVENAIKHGIQMLGEEGTIKITTRKMQDSVLLTVEDNGVGIKKEDVEDILDFKGEASKSSFGLRATIERLRLFYGIEDVINIKSDPGVGTQILIKVPVQTREELLGDKNDE